MTTGGAPADLEISRNKAISGTAAPLPLVRWELRPAKTPADLEIKKSDNLDNIK